MPEGEITKSAVAHYAIMNPDIPNLAQVVADNTGAAGLGEFDIDRIVIPSGGGLSWNVPNLDGHMEPLPALEGVVIAFKDGRAYWPGDPAEGLGGIPPNCKSDDGFIGIGDPGGDCSMCPNAQFGTRARGKGQACKMIRLLFLVRPQSLLPVIVKLPVTSISACRKFFARLAGAGIPFCGAVVRIGLEQERNDANIAYSQATFALASRLSPDETARFKAIGQAIMPKVRSAAVEN